MSDRPKPTSHRLRLAITVRQEGDYWLATAGKLDSYGTGYTPATAVESCMQSIITRAKIFREARGLQDGVYVDLDAWERWCGGESPAGGTAPRATPPAPGT